MTRICFLVPTFNRARFIGEALTAILDQAGPDDELIVVDDGSTDGTDAEVARAAPSARYVRQPNAGKGAAMNRGLALTDARYLWVCDDDDVLLPGAVDALWSASRDGTAPLVFGRYQRFRDEAGARRIFDPGYRPDLSTGPLVRHVLEDLFVMQNATLVATDAVRAIGGFSERLVRSVDYEFFVRLFASFPAILVDRDIFLQRQHDQVRGPLANPVARASNDAVWAKADREIFRSFARHAPLSLFEAMFEGTPRNTTRAAHLERAAILARHDCWDLACADFAAAAACSSDLLGPTERAICRRALSGKHNIAGIFRDNAIARLREMARRSRHGQEILGAMIRGSLWRLRGSDSRQAMLVARLIATFPLAAIGGAIRAPRANVTTERVHLPTTAFVPAGSLPKV